MQNLSALRSNLYGNEDRLNIGLSLDYLTKLSGYPIGAEDIRRNSESSLKVAVTPEAYSRSVQRMYNASGAPSLTMGIKLAQYTWQAPGGLLFFVNDGRAPDQYTIRIQLDKE